MNEELKEQSAMPFVPYGKKAKKKQEQVAKIEARERIIDRAIGLTREPMNRPGLCLPMSVFYERLLGEILPEPQFRLRLGSLWVQSLDPSLEKGISFDPRGPDGIDGGFHAWLEGADGSLLDPSIGITLHSHGYDTDPNDYMLAKSRTFVLAGLAYKYDELPELGLLGVEESRPLLESWLATALIRLDALRLLEASGGMGSFRIHEALRYPFARGQIYLDVGWRADKASRA